MAGRIFTITGPDGVGKTTLLGRLRQLGYETAESSDARGLVVGDGSPLVGKFLPEAVADHGPLSRAAEIGRVLVVFYEYVLQPRLAQGRDVIVDSYCVRMCAREHVLNPDGDALLQSICACLPRPFLVTVLECDLRAAYRRNRLGHAFDYIDPDDRSYRSYAAMQRARGTFMERTCLRDLRVNRIDVPDDPEALARRYVEVLEAHGCLRGRADATEARGPDCCAPIHRAGHVPLSEERR